MPCSDPYHHKLLGDFPALIVRFELCMDAHLQYATLRLQMPVGLFGVSGKRWCRKQWERTKIEQKAKKFYGWLPTNLLGNTCTTACSRKIRLSHSPVPYCMTSKEAVQKESDRRKALTLVCTAICTVVMSILWLTIWPSPQAGYNVRA